MLDSTVLVAAITGTATVLGSAVSALVTYFVMRRQDELSRLRRELRISLMDVSAFHRLEALAVETIAEHEAHNTPEAIKRRLRRTLREMGHDTPSYRATSTRAEAKLRTLPLSG